MSTITNLLIYSQILARIKDTSILHPCAMIVIFIQFNFHFIANELWGYINIISSNRFTSFELLANLLILLILDIITPILLITWFFILNIITSNRQTLIINVSAIIRYFYLTNYSRSTIYWIIKLFTSQCDTRWSGIQQWIRIAWLIIYKYFSASRVNVWVQLYFLTRICIFTDLFSLSQFSIAIDLWLTIIS